MYLSAVCKMNQLYLTRFMFSIIFLVVFENGVIVSAVRVEQFLSLSLQEKTALDQFRSKVKPLLTGNCMRHDTYLIRWLRARNFDINAAERMLRENLRWRKENKIDNIKNEDFRDMEQDYPQSIDTYDKIGQPIGTFDIYEWDIRRAVLEGKTSRYNRYVVFLVENITTQACERQEQGMNVTQVVVLLNADGLNVVQQACPVCIPLWIHFVNVIENYYPEWIDEFIVVDSSPAVGVLMNALRPLFSKNSRNAIKIFGHNRSKWIAYLDNKISRSERTKAYGGTKPPLRY